jgi:hypothetical protein
MSWTEEKPTEDGFYWYRGYRGCEVVEIEIQVGTQLMYPVGCETVYSGKEIHGKFWSEKLEAPNGQG